MTLRVPADSEHVVVPGHISRVVIAPSQPSVTQVLDYYSHNPHTLLVRTPAAAYSLAKSTVDLVVANNHKAGFLVEIRNLPDDREVFGRAESFLREAEHGHPLRQFFQRFTRPEGGVDQTAHRQDELKMARRDMGDIGLHVGGSLINPVAEPVRVQSPVLVWSSPTIASYRKQLETLNSVDGNWVDRHNAYFVNSFKKNEATGSLQFYLTPVEKGGMGIRDVRLPATVASENAMVELRASYLVDLLKGMGLQASLRTLEVPDPESIRQLRHPVARRIPEGEVVVTVVLQRETRRFRVR